MRTLPILFICLLLSTAGQAAPIGTLLKDVFNLPSAISKGLRLPKSETVYRSVDRSILSDLNYDDYIHNTKFNVIELVKFKNEGTDVIVSLIAVGKRNPQKRLAITFIETRGDSYSMMNSKFREVLKDFEEANDLKFTQESGSHSNSDSYYRRKTSSEYGRGSIGTNVYVSGTYTSSNNFYLREAQIKNIDLKDIKNLIQDLADL